MIHLVLNDLRRPAGEVLRACLHLQSLIPHLDCLITLTLTGATKKRQAPFLGVVCSVLLDDFGIKHHRICRSSSALVEKCNNAFANAYHIRRHTDTAFSVCHQRVKQILCDLQIFLRCNLRLPSEENGIVHQLLDHNYASSLILSIYINEIPVFVFPNCPSVV